MNIKKFGHTISNNIIVRFIEQSIGSVIVDVLTRKKDIFYVFSCAGIGDTVAIASLAGYLKEIYKFKKMILVCKQNHQDVGELYGAFDGVKTINRFSMFCLSICNRVGSRVYGKNYVIGNYRLLFKTWHCYEHRLDAFKICILQIPLSYLPYSVNHPEAEDVLGLGLRDIIIAPYANTFKTLPLRVWEQIANTLSSNGYNVYTNICTNSVSNEKPIKGTKSLDAPLRDIFIGAARCKAVISYRSGFSDFLSLNYETHHIVIYPDERTAKFEDVAAYGSKRIISLVEPEDINTISETIIKLIENLE